MATHEASLLHTPPDVASVQVVPLPTQNEVLAAPIGVGAGFTVNVPVVKPKSVVYVTVTTPDETPIRIPDVSMVATPGLLLCHVPPGDRLSDKYRSPPTHRVPEDGVNGEIAKLANDITIARDVRINRFIKFSFSGF